MKRCLGSRNRFVGILLVFALALTQVGCATFQLSGSMLPEGDEPGGPNPRDSVSGGTSAGAVIGYLTLAAVAGYVVYKLLIDDSQVEDGGSDAAPAAVHSGGSPVDTLDLPTPQRRPAASPGGS
jgi:hypothetical protein